MCEKERRKAMVGVVQPHKINVVLMTFHFSEWVNPVRKMNRHVHFFLTSVEKNQYCSTEERRRGARDSWQLVHNPPLESAKEPASCRGGAAA